MTEQGLKHWRFPHLRNRFHTQAFRFALSAVAGFGMGIFWALFFHEKVGWSEELAAALSILLVSIQNFLVFLGYVFKPDRRMQFKTLATGFALSVAGFRGVEYLIFLLLHTLMGFQYLVVLVVVRIGLMGVKFFFYRSTLFAEQREVQ